MKQPIQNTEQRVVAGFFNQYNATEIKIVFRGCYISKERMPNATRGQLNLMPIITHPERRIVLKDGEWAKMQTEHPNPELHFLNNIILLRGTPYGLIVMFGRALEYERLPGGQVWGPIPHLHTTARFTAAAMRYFKRKGEKFFGDRDLLNWIFSENFEQDLQEQAQLDRETQAGMSLANYVEGQTPADYTNLLLGDGLPPRRRSEHPLQKNRPSSNPNPVKYPTDRRAQGKGDRRQLVTQD